MPKLNSCRGHSQVTRFTVSASTAHCTAHCARAHKTTKTKAAAEDVAAQQPSNCQRISKSKWNEVAAEAQPNEPKVKCELNECHDRKSSSTSSSGSRLRCQRERSLDREGESDCAVVQFFTVVVGNSRSCCAATAHSAHANLNWARQKCLRAN